MKLAFISLMQGFPWGGSEELWFETALHASKNNHEVQVFAKYWEMPSAKIRTLENIGIKVSFYDQKIPVEQDFFNRLFKFLARKIIPKKSVDNKWSQSLEKLKRFSPDILIINQGGTFDLANEPVFFYFLKENAIPYFLICQYLSDFGNSLHETVASRSRELMTRAKEVYFVSERNKITTERLLVQKLSNAKVVNNPVNIISKEMIAFPPSENGFNLACVARLEIAYKGQDYLLQVLSEKKWKERNWSLSLFGNGPDNELLKKQISYFGLENKIKLEGHVSDIRGIWEKHHILILPSIGEGTPLALAEAMLCGRSAIVTAAGGNAELIIDEINGFVSPCSLPEYLNEAMERAWERRSEWKELGEKAFSTSYARYKENSGSTLLKLILNK